MRISDWSSDVCSSDLKTDGGLILSASHNPAGADGDFGLKYNIPAGGPAPESITETIFARTREIRAYRILDGGEVDISRLGQTKLGGMAVEVIDPVASYAELMRSLFDFSANRALFAPCFPLRFDALTAAPGPYSNALLETAIGP